MNVLYIILLLAVSGKTVLLPAPAANCDYPEVSIANWPVQEVGGLPGVTMHIPVSLEEEFTLDSTFVSWMDGIDAVFAASITGESDEPLFELPTPQGRPEYQRCMEQLDGMHAEFVTYNLREDFVDIGSDGPFHMYAVVGLPDKSKLLLLGNSTERTTLQDFVAILRSIRRRDTR